VGHVASPQIKRQPGGAGVGNLGQPKQSAVAHTRGSSPLALIRAAAWRIGDTGQSKAKRKLLSAAMWRLRKPPKQLAGDKPTRQNISVDVLAAATTAGLATGPP